MPNLLKSRNFILVLVGIFAVFIPLGLVIGKFTQSRLTKNELLMDSQSRDSAPATVSRYGKVVYVNPNTFPADKVSYLLEEPSGKETLLFSTDQKLVLAEGLGVQVVGVLEKSADGKYDLIRVDHLIINSMEKK